MYRFFAHNSSIADVYDIIINNTSLLKHYSWRCYISSSYPISGFFEFDLFADFFAFICQIYGRYSNIKINIYFKSSFYEKDSSISFRPLEGY